MKFGLVTKNCSDKARNFLPLGFGNCKRTVRRGVAFPHQNSDIDLRIVEACRRLDGSIRSWKRVLLRDWIYSIPGLGTGPTPRWRE